MDDAALVSAHLAGDRDAFAAIYDRYADRLHDFCHSVLRDRHEAADALQDTMLVAHQRMHQLRDPERLRPWLFSIARHESYRRTRARARTTPTDDLGDDMTADHAPPDSALRADETSRVVWDAAAGLAARDRIVLDLHVRQGLSGGDLGQALGVTAHHADVLVSRVRQRVERSLGALLVSRLGRDDCTELNTLLDGWDGTFSVLMRKRVAGHVDDCPVCDDTRTRVAGPVALLGAIPLLPAPTGLRDRVLGEVERISSSTSGPGRARSSTWHPPPLYRVSPRRRVAAGATTLVVVALAFVLLGGSPAEPVALTTDTTPTSPVTDDEMAADDATGPSATTDPDAAPDVAGTALHDPPTPPTAPAAPGGAPDDVAPPLPGPSSPGPAPGPPAPDQGTAPGTVAPPPNRSGTTTSTTPPEMVLSTSSLSLTPARPTARFSIRNRGEGQLDWSASSGAFDLTTTSGALGPGQAATIEVTLPAGAAEGTHDGGVIVDGAGQTQAVTVEVDRPPVIARATVTTTTAACGDTVRVTAHITDESPLTASVRWTTPSGSGSVPMTAGANNTWTADVPVTTGPMSLLVLATDSRGNRSSADAGTVEVIPCRTPAPGGPRGFTG